MATLELAQRLLTLLVDTDHHLSEADIGSALAKCSPDKERVIDTWVWWCGEAKRNKCRREYKNLRTASITLSHIGLTVQRLSPQAYLNWYEPWLREALFQAAKTLSDADLAAALCRLYWLNLIPGKDDMWSFRVGASEQKIHERLSEDLAEEFKRFSQWMCTATLLESRESIMQISNGIEQVIAILKQPDRQIKIYVKTHDYIKGLCT